MGIRYLQDASRGRYDRMGAWAGTTIFRSLVVVLTLIGICVACKPSYDTVIIATLTGATTASGGYKISVHHTDGASVVGIPDGWIKFVEGTQTVSVVLENSSIFRDKTTATLVLKVESAASETSSSLAMGAVQVTVTEGKFSEITMALHNDPREPLESSFAAHYGASTGAPFDENMDAIYPFWSAVPEGGLTGFSYHLWLAEGDATPRWLGLVPVSGATHYEPSFSDNSLLSNDKLKWYLSVERVGLTGPLSQPTGWLMKGEPPNAAGQEIIQTALGHLDGFLQALHDATYHAGLAISSVGTESSVRSHSEHAANILIGATSDGTITSHPFLNEVDYNANGVERPKASNNDKGIHGHLALLASSMDLLEDLAFGNILSINTGYLQCSKRIEDIDTSLSLAEYQAAGVLVDKIVTAAGLFSGDFTSQTKADAFQQLVDRLWGDPYDAAQTATDENQTGYCVRNRVEALSTFRFRSIDEL